MQRILHGTLDLSDGRDWQRNHSSFTPSLLTFQFPPSPSPLPPPPLSPSHSPYSSPIPTHTLHPSLSYVTHIQYIHIHEAFLSYLFSIFFSSVVFSNSYLFSFLNLPSFPRFSLPLHRFTTISCSCYIAYTSSCFLHFFPHCLLSFSLFPILLFLRFTSTL